MPLLAIAAPAKEETSINIVCQPPCALSQKQLRRTGAALTAQMREFEAHLKTEIPARLKPIEVHLAYDEKCRKTAPQHVERNLSGFSHQNYGGDEKGVICLNSGYKKIIAGESSFFHELAHMYLMINRYEEEESYEEVLARAIEYYAKYRGLGPKGICGLWPKNYNENNEIFCENFDMPFAAVPLLVKELAKKKSEGQLTNDMVRGMIAPLMEVTSGCPDGDA